MLDAIAEMLGRESPVLRIGFHRLDADEEPSLVTVDLETIGADVPEGSRLDGLGVASHRDARTGRASVRPAALDRPARARTDADRPAVGRPGLVRPGHAVDADRMAEHGLATLGPPILVQAWGISMVLRAPSTQGDVYLKCTSPVFRTETTLTALLAADAPDLVTRVIAIDVDEGWLLMHDLAGPPLGDSPPEAWAPGLEVLATLQHRWTDRTGILIEAGASVRSLDDLMRDVPTYADREPLRSELRPAERAEWIAAVPGFVAACARLGTLGPAPTLSHGDFHPWNVAATPDGPRIFDWSDTAIAHPFLDLAVYATRIRGCRRPPCPSGRLPRVLDRRPDAGRPRGGRRARHRRRHALPGRGVHPHARRSRPRRSSRADRGGSLVGARRHRRAPGRDRPAAVRPRRRLRPRIVAMSARGRGYVRATKRPRRVVSSSA